MRNKIFDRVSHWATEHPWRTLIIFGLVTLIALGMGRRLEIKLRWSDLLPEQDPSVQEFNKIIKQYDSASSIILVVQGDENRIKAFAEEVAEPISKVEGVKWVTYKIDEDFIRNHGLMLMRTKDLQNSKDLFSDLSLESLLTHINDNLERTYVYSEDEERLSTKEKTDQAIRTLEGIQFWLNTMRAYFEGSDGSDWARRAVDRMLLGERYFLSYDKRTLLMMIQPNFPATDMEPSFRTVNALRQVLKEARKKHPDVQAGLTGMAVMGVEEYESVMGGMWWTSIVAFLVIIALLIFAFRMWVAPLLAGAVLIVGVIWTTGFAAVTTGYLNLMTYFFAVILFGLGIDFSIHIITGFTESRGQGLSIPEAMQNALRKVGPGVVTGATTTAVVFLTLLISRNRGMSQFGLIVGAGVIFCMLAAFFVLPSLLVLRERRLEKGKHRSHTRSYEFRFLGNFAERYSRIGWPAIIAAIPVTAFFAYQASRLKFDYNMLNIEPKGMPSVVLEETVLREFDLSPDYALVTAPSLDSARALTERAKRFRNIAQVESITEYLPAPVDQQKRSKIIQEIRQNLLRNDSPRPITLASLGRILEQLERLWMNVTEMSSLAYQAGQDRLEATCYELVENPEEAGSRDFLRELITLFRSDPDRAVRAFNRFQRDYFGYLHQSVLQMANPEPITLDEVPREIIDRYRSKDGQHWLVSIFPKKYIWDLESLRAFTLQLKYINPRTTGIPPMFMSLIDYVAADGKRASALAFIIVFILLMIDFRSLGRTLLAMIPLLIGTAWMAGLASLGGMMLNVNNVLALPLILGIGIDDGVHFIHRYQIEGWRRIPIIFSSTGKAALLTSLTTMIGFGSLVLLPHRGTASMGLILVIGIGACFITVVLILAPAFRLVKYK